MKYDQIRNLITIENDKKNVQCPPTKYLHECSYRFRTWIHMTTSYVILYKAEKLKAQI